MKGIFYNTKGIREKVERTNKSTLWLCNKGHWTNYLQQEIKCLKNGVMRIREVCPVCKGNKNTIAKTLKEIENGGIR